MKRKIPTNGKKIINQYLSGKRISDISRNTKVARSTLYQWVKNISKDFSMSKPLNLRDYHYLKSKCERQALIIQI